MISTGGEDEVEIKTKKTKHDIATACLALDVMQSQTGSSDVML